jgi:NADP-dependent aldehyde dehydrogenase
MKSHPLEGFSLIGGKPFKSTGPVFQGRDRFANSNLMPVYLSASEIDVDVAARLASTAARDFGRCPAKKRAEFLRRIADNIENLGVPLIERASRETALSSARIEGERSRTCNQLRLFAGLIEEGSWSDPRIDPGDPTRKPQPKPDVRSLLRPIGPVAIFGASNFPLAFSVAGGDTAAALAAGCPVIFKAHPGHPGTSEMVGRAIAEAVTDIGLPAGTFSLLFDSGFEVGTRLVSHPSIKAASFTGSRKGGLALWKIAMGRPEPIPFFAEMSSVNPVFVFPDAMRAKTDAIVAGLHTAMTFSAGQLCTQPGLVFIVDGEPAKKFLEGISKLVRETPPAILLNAGIQDAYDGAVSKRGASAGVRRLDQAVPVAGQASAALFAVDSKGFLREPELAEEIFGPSSLIVLCGSVEEFSVCAERLEGQLAASVWGEPGEIGREPSLLTILEEKVGRLILNGFSAGVEVNHAMVHGGPFPATTDSRFTSVGTRSFLRFVRPISFQNFPDSLLPDELKGSNPLGIRRQVDGKIEG